MSDQGDENSTGAQADNGENPDRPVVELFVKAAVDKMKNGGCPICHRYFMVFYILREKGLIDLVVTTFLPENPPKEVLAFSNGKRYPLILIHKGVDANGQDMTGLGCDTLDEIESLIERFDCDDMYGRRDSKGEDRAERVFEDAYKKFMMFLKNPSDDIAMLTKQLEKLDAYLRDNGTKFLLGDSLVRADCILLPVLQHIRVAGKAYKNYEIPTELVYVWRYLGDAYDTETFRESCPADREIIAQYETKASCRPLVGKRRSQLMGEERTMSVPETNVAGNGDLQPEDED